MQTYPYKLILKFYVLYGLLCLLGNLFINYNSISILTFLLVLIYVFGLVSGSYIGFKKTNRRSYYLFVVKTKSIINMLFWLLSLSVFYCWLIMISYYGSLENIILNSYTIRVNSIGSSVSIFPLYLTYLNSLVHASFVLTLVYYELVKEKKYIYLSVWFFILIILIDLLTFGRIGILYGIFTFLGYVIIYKKFKINIKNIILLSLLFFILMLPRLIRGSFDNMYYSIINYYPYFLVDIPDYLYLFISVYIYYFSSIYAFDSFINSSTNELSYGLRMFTPIAHMLEKLFSMDRTNTIDPMVRIPFEFNIYTILKDMYQDFSFIGILLLPLIIGYLFGYFFKKQTLHFNAIKVYSLGWLFYTPIYNAFSFGGFFISFIFLFLLTLTKDVHEKN